MSNPYDHKALMAEAEKVRIEARRATWRCLVTAKAIRNDLDGLPWPRVEITLGDLDEARSQNVLALQWGACEQFPTRTKWPEVFPQPRQAGVISCTAQLFSTAL